MRCVLFAVGVCVAPFIAPQLGAQDSVLIARESSMLNMSSPTDAPWGSRDMVRAIRPNLQQQSTLQPMANEGRGSSAVRRGAWIGAGIGLTAGLTGGVMIAYTGGGFSGELVAGTVFMSTVAAGVCALLGAGVGKVVQLTVSHPSGQP